jgi:hypothetical protein
VILFKNRKAIALSDVSSSNCQDNFETKIDMNSGSINLIHMEIIMSVTYTEVPN